MNYMCNDIKKNLSDKLWKVRRVVLSLLVNEKRYKFFEVAQFRY